MKKLKSIEKPEDKNTAERIFPQSMKPFLEKGYHGASIGERQMLVMGRVLMTDPKIMLLDEPSLGLSPLMVRESFRIIRRINAEERASILLVEQNAKIALGVSEYCYVMENGRVVMNDSSKILMENEDIKEFYLGLSTTTLNSFKKNHKAHITGLKSSLEASFNFAEIQKHLKILGFYF